VDSLVTSTVYDDGTNVGVSSTAPSSTLHIGGSVALPFITIPGTFIYTISNTDHTIRLTGSVFLLFLPDATICPGRIYNIMTSNSANVFNLLSNGGNIFDDATGGTVSSLNPNERYTFQSDGIDWYVIGR
jgi:hypothetical protein